MSRVMLITAIILAVGYVMLAWKKHGENLISVSSIAYILPSWMFTVVLGLESILLAPSIFEHLPNDWQFIGFLCLLGLWAVAASPYFHTEARTLHNIGGFGFCIISQVVVIFGKYCLLFGWLPALCYIVLSDGKKDKTFWAEVTAYVILVFNLIV